MNRTRAYALTRGPSVSWDGHIQADEEMKKEILDLVRFDKVCGSANASNHTAQKLAGTEGVTFPHSLSDLHPIVQGLPLETKRDMFSEPSIGAAKVQLRAV